MIRSIGRSFAAFFRATTPDPFVLAILLTFVVFGLAAALEGSGPVEIVNAWRSDKGFWGLLAFAMQMVLILVTGHALAASPIVSRGIARVARLPKTGAQAAFLVALLAVSGALLNWGLGLVVGALVAREVGRSCRERGVNAHYPLLAAAGYTGMMVWHGGLSGSAPLKMTTRAEIASMFGEDLARTIEPVPFTETVLGVQNLVVTGGLVLLVPILCALLAPREGEPIEDIEQFAPADQARDDDAPPATWPERIERSPWLTALVVLPLLGAIVLFVIEDGFAKLDPNSLNLMFLTAGLILHGSVHRYVRAIGEATRGAAGIVLQFPFYAGIMGVMRVTGLTTTFASSVVAVASAQTYPLLTFAAASVINLFVPSGGGQWAVQGPIAIEAARTLDVPMELAIMSVAYGDQLSNMLQPFWALPLLAITGVRARDVIGYTAVIMILGGLYVGVCLYLLA